MSFLKNLDQLMTDMAKLVAEYTTLKAHYTPNPNSVWTAPNEAGGRLHKTLLKHRQQCLEGGATVENRALWLFGNTAMLLNCYFMVLLDEEPVDEEWHQKWINCQTKFFPGITSYLYGWEPEGLDPGVYNLTDGTPLFYGMQWYSNQTPHEARVTLEGNLQAQWTFDNIQRWAEEDIAMADWEYDQSKDKEQYLKDHPYYIKPEGWN
jgi:hypothetical protein